MRWRGYGQFRNWSVAQGLDSAPDLGDGARCGRHDCGSATSASAICSIPAPTTLEAWPQAMVDGGWSDAIALLPRARRMWALFNQGQLVRYDLDTPAGDSGGRRSGLVEIRRWSTPRGGCGSARTARCGGGPAGCGASAAHGACATGLPADTNYLGASTDPARAALVGHQPRPAALCAAAVCRRGAARPGARRRAVRRGAVGGDGALWLAQIAGGLLRHEAGDGNTLSVQRSDDALLAGTALYSLEVDRQRAPVGISRRRRGCAGRGALAPADAPTVWSGTTCRPVRSSPMRTARSGWAPAAASRTCCIREHWATASVPAPVLLQARYGDDAVH